MSVLSKVDVLDALTLYGFDTEGMNVESIQPDDLDQHVLGELALRLLTPVGIAADLESLGDFDLGVLTSGSNYLDSVSKWAKVDLVGALAMRSKIDTGNALPKELIQSIAKTLDAFPNTIRNLWTTFQNWPHDTRNPNVEFSKHKMLNGKPYRYDVIAQVEEEGLTVVQLGLLIKDLDNAVDIVDVDVIPEPDEEEEEESVKPVGIDWWLTFQQKVGLNQPCHVHRDSGALLFVFDDGVRIKLLPRGSAIEVLGG